MLQSLPTALEQELDFSQHELDSKVEALCPSYAQPLAECAACTEAAVSEGTVHSVATDFNFKLYRFRTPHSVGVSTRSSLFKSCSRRLCPGVTRDFS